MHDKCCGPSTKFKCPGMCSYFFLIQVSQFMKSFICSFFNIYLLICSFRKLQASLILDSGIFVFQDKENDYSEDFIFHVYHREQQYCIINQCHSFCISQY